MSTFRQKAHDDWAYPDSSLYGFKGRYFTDPLVQSLKLTQRTWNCLFNEFGTNATVEKICTRTGYEWFCTPNFGPKSFRELASEVERVGYSLGGAPSRTSGSG